MTCRYLQSRRVVLGGGDSPLRIAAARVRIEGTTITQIEELDDGDHASLPPGSVVDDYGDKLVTPAFINAHTHLALGFLRGYDMGGASLGNMVEDFFFEVETKLGPDDVSAFARIGAYDSLLSGVGLVWDHYYRGERIAQALREVGLCGVVAPTLQDLSGPGQSDWEEQLDTTARLASGAEWAGSGIYAALGPHATDTVSEGLWLRAVELAETHDLPIHAHLAQSPEEYARSVERNGCSPTAWLARLGVFERAPAGAFAHGIYASEADLDLLAEAKQHLVWCPYSALVFGYPAPVLAWEARGVPWAIATDCASNNDTMNVQQELRFIAAQRTLATTSSEAARAVLRDGTAESVDAAWNHRREAYEAHADLVAPERMLSRLWDVPGAMHPGFVAGRIAEGALANLLVFDLDHPALWPAVEPLRTLTMADAAPAIWAMYGGGRLLGEPGNFHRSILNSDGYRDARVEASDRLRRILS
ncbi:MAG: amidohydrolase family protein [Polyangiaceae bacterium]